MLDQNTDRMWYVIGAVIIGAAIILILNGTAPEIFASVADTFKETTEETTAGIDEMGAIPVGVNLLKGSHTRIVNDKYLIKDYELLYDSLRHGDEVTMTIKGELSPHKTAFGIYNSGGHGLDRVVSFAHADFNDDGIAQKTFTWRIYEDDNANNRINVYTLYNSSDGGVDNVTNEIDWITLERGPGTPI